MTNTNFHYKGDKAISMVKSFDNKVIPNSKLEQLIAQTREWFYDKGIIGNSNTLKQLEKTQEELTEIRDAAVIMDFVDDRTSDRNFVDSDYYQAKLKLKDGIGDTLVTLIGVCEMEGVTIEECLQLAYDVISKRSGKMVDGKFIKDV